MRQELAASVLLIVTGCAHRSPAVSSNPYFYKSDCPAELTRRFVEGDPIDKMGAAEIMIGNDCVEGVPIILRELRTLAASSHCEDVPFSDEVHEDTVPPRCTVEWKGQRVPYIDYHDPLYKALERLTGIGYFEPDEAWLAALDAWVATHPREAAH